MTDDEKRGKLLSELRKKKGLTQQELSELIHYSDKNISKWERGKSFPTNPNIINKLANIFDVSLEEIMYGELRQEENEDEINNNLKKEYLSHYNKYIRLIKKSILLILTLIIIAMILIYLVYIKNSVKLYVSEIEGDNIAKNKVTILLTNKKNLLTINKLESKDKEITNISLFYIKDNREILVLSGANQVYYIEDNYGYDEYNLETIVKTKSYIKLEYDDSTEEIIDLMFSIDYSNDKIFPSSIQKISNDNYNENNLKNIEEDFLLKGFTKEEIYLKKDLSDNVVCMYNTYSNIINISINNTEVLENVSSSILKKEIRYEKFNQGNMIENKIINIHGEKNCDEETCSTINDFAMYINYLKNN